MLHTGLYLFAIILASAVEMVEAMTIVLASGITRGWRSTLEGAGVALVVLAALVGVFGPTLGRIDINILRLVIGTFLLIFGLQWLRKAILRASGYKSQRDEALIFQTETQLLSKGADAVKGRRDPIAFTVSFKGVFLEGMEVIVIVISFGASDGRLGLAALGAGIAALAVGGAGFALAKPLAAVPENTMKLAVGLLLTTFGTFWGAEGAGMEWPLGDIAILLLLALYAVVTFTAIAYLKRSRIATARVAG